MIHECFFASRSEEWPTPVYFFAQLDSEFKFALDPCATKENAKCARYFTKEDDGLKQDWDNATVVLLAHSRTDTRWFHEWVYAKADIRFVRGRLRFGAGKQSAPFPSLVAIYRARVIS